jgi:hypothetical protein
MTLLYVSRNHVPLDEGDVRSTTNVVNPDDESANAKAAPEFNTVERDPDTEGGLTPRAVSDKANASVHYPPLIGNANAPFDALVNAQVSTSGTAAQREIAGEWGHGTGYFQEAIEPTIRPGTEFDNTYFKASRPPIQDGTMDYMLPSRRPDTAVSGGDQAAANRAAREARANLYQAFLEGR